MSLTITSYIPASMATIMCQVSLKGSGSTWANEDRTRNDSKQSSVIIIKKLDRNITVRSITIRILISDFSFFEILKERH